MAEPLRVLALVPYHLDFCAGQRFRIELWARRLESRNINVEFVSFTDQELTSTLYRHGNIVKKGARLSLAIVRHLNDATRRARPDAIFIYREAAVAGPPIVERIVRRWGVPIIYDIDEPLFVPYVSPSSGQFNRLKFFGKYDRLMAASDKVLAVNEAIAEHARRFCDDVTVVPMAVDLDRYKPGNNDAIDRKPTIVWVGTRTNQPNLRAVLPALRRLAKEQEFRLRIIADDPMDLDDLDVEFVPWSFAGEVPALQASDIGITPVLPSPWAPWKFFFKTVQCMAVGLPVVASDIGSNKEIVVNGENGFLAGSDEDWYVKLGELLRSRDLRRELGNKARRTAVEDFGLEKQIDLIEHVFRTVADERSAARRVVMARATHKAP